MSYSSEVLADSPFIYCQLNQTVGTTATDSSGNGRDGTYNGTFTLNQAGKVTQSGAAACKLNGSSGYISFPSTGVPTGNSNFTQEIWTRLDATGSTGVIIAWGTGNTLQEPNFYVDSSGNLYVSTWNTDTLVQAMSVGTWYQLVSTWDGTIHKAYVNGSLVTSPTPGTIATPASPTFTVGRNPNPVEYFAPITVQEMSAYSTCLSAARILAHYQAGIANQLAGQARATFTTQTSLSGRARSVFVVSTNLSGKARSTFDIQASLKGEAHAAFPIRTALAGPARAVFATRTSLAGFARTTFSVSSSLVGQARTAFKVAAGLKGLADVTFKISGNVVQPTPLIAWFATTVSRLQAAFTGASRLSVGWVVAAHIIATFTRSAPVAQPNSTTDVTATVKLPDGTFPTISTITSVVTFPDGSTHSYSLANGDIVSLGSGQYKLTYTSKGPGVHNELWTFTANDGSVGTYLNHTPVGY
jgi:hypothetical protein